MLKKNQKLLEMMNEIDEKYIEEAEKMSFRPRKNIWKHVTSIAACAALVASIATFPIWGDFGNPNPEIGVIDPVGKEYVWDAEAGVFTLSTKTNTTTTSGFAQGESIVEMPAIGEIVIIGEGEGEDAKPTPNVLYPYITGEYAGYSLTKGRVMEQYIGEKLGNVTMAGDDGDTLTAEMYAILGIDTKCAVAVKYPKYSYCIFYNPDLTFESFADFKAAYSLDTELYMGFIMVEHIVADNSDHLQEMRDIAPLKAKILALEGNACTYEEFANGCDMKNSIGMDVANGALWVYTHEGLQIFEDGYLITNLGGTIQIFNIGEDAAKEIISDAKANRYTGVEFYSEKRDVLVGDSQPDSSDNPSVPEMSGAYVPEETETSASDAYGLTTPSYDPHEAMPKQTEMPTETTTAVPPHMPEAIPETATEPSPFETNPLIYEGVDPYASSSAK